MKLKRLDYYQFNKILNERLNLFEWTCKEYDVTYGIENDKNRFELIVDSDRVDGSNGSHRIHTVEDILFHIKDFDDTYWVYADEQTCREAQIALKKLEDKYNKKYSEIEFDNFLCDEIRKANPYRRIKITPVCLDDRTYLSNIHKQFMEKVISKFNQNSDVKMYLDCKEQGGELFIYGSSAIE